MELLNINHTNCLNHHDSYNAYEKLMKLLNASTDYKNNLTKFRFLNEVYNNEGVEEIKKISEAFGKKFNHFCVLGTGGSSLGSQALTGLIPEMKSKKISFLYDIDPIFFQNSLNSLNIYETGFIVISKSGSTPETIAQLGALLQKFEDSDSISLVRKNFIVITEDKKSPLSYIAKKFNIRTLNHNKDIGGRFSVFSNVALFPAALVGIDIVNFIKGGKKILDDVIINGNQKPFEGAAILVLMQQLHNININVLFTYSDSLKNFGLWYRQLWSESIGKEGNGLTPFHSIGTVDQHSQLQLFLDGPKDKFFTFIKSNHSNKGPLIHSAFLNQSGMHYLAGKKIGDLMEAEQNATIKTLINKKLPIKEIFVKNINAESLGSLMMYCFLETISVGKILNIDVFNQPAVEEGKILTKKYLS